MIPVGILTAAATSSFSFLLDNYPGANAAYSLRKLRSAYTGNCVRVLNTSLGTSIDIGFVNNVIDLVTMQTFVGASTGRILTWYDQSGNGNNATDAGGPYIIIAGNLQTLNSLPCVNFTLNATLTLTNTILANTNLSIFMAARGVSTSSNGMMIGGTGAPTVFFGSFSTAIGANIAIGAGLNGSYNFVTTVPNYGTANYSIFNCVVNSSSYNVYQNNNTFTQTNVPVSLSPTSFQYLGRYNNIFSDSRTTEIIIYKTDQLANRTGIVNNINTFYTIF